MKKISTSLFHAGFQKELETQMLEAAKQTERYMRTVRRADCLETRNLTIVEAIRPYRQTRIRDTHLPLRNPEQK